MLSKRAKSGFAAGASALGVLLAMSLNIGGIDGFYSIVTSLAFLFSGAVFVAFVLGCFTSQIRLRWNVLEGAMIGLLTGFGVLLIVLRNI